MVLQQIRQSLLFPVGQVMPSIRQRLAKAQAHERKLIARIESAHAAGNKDSADRHTTAYLKSFNAKLAAANSAAALLKGNGGTASREQLLLSLAEGGNPWQRCDEPVVINAKPKMGNNCDFRLVACFGPRNKVLQQLISPILHVRAHVDERQYAVKGGGRNIAVESVSKSLLQGWNWVAEIDLKDCYPSFDEEKVINLIPLPKAVSENIVTSRRLNLIPGNIGDFLGQESDSEEVAEVLSEARRGIAQGSSLSPLVAEILLAPVFGMLPDKGRVVAYADNFLATAETKEDVAAMAKALCAALKQLPVGPLCPKVKSFGHSSDGFNFLGYRLHSYGGNVVAMPTQANYRSFCFRLEQGLAAAKRAGLTPDQRRRRVRQVERYIRSWTAAFSLWKDAVPTRVSALVRARKVLEGH